jgi:hypothetical protein
VNRTGLHIKRVPSKSSYQGGRQLTVFLCEHLQLHAMAVVGLELHPAAIKPSLIS